MNREEKAATVDELAAQIEGVETIFAVDYRGISVPQAAELRAKLREADARFRVVKNRLTLRAVEKAGREELRDVLEGPTAFAFVAGDAVVVAKAIAQFRREHDILAYKGGFMEGERLEPEQFDVIARLPGREALNAQLAGMVASPLTGLVRGLGALISGLAIQLKQIEEQGLVAGVTPPDFESSSSAPDTDSDAEPPEPADPGTDSPAAEITEDLPETETAGLAGEPDPEPAGEAPADSPEEQGESLETDDTNEED